MQDINKLINDDLRGLRKQFQSKGFDIRVVGGAVRDFLNGQIPHDVDLCTDAFPDEQLALYQEFGLHFIPTGEKHGTYTVVINGEGYEITSLRTESEHDGRYAKMAFTRDWTEDASRRDLTINAMALTFDGEIVDPFGGLNDLRLGLVRFVGNAEERMEEDYLRILRYFRFLGRYGEEHSAKANIPGDELYRTVGGLQNISAERIWSEMKKIIAHPSASWILPLMEYHSVLDIIQFPGPTDKWRFFDLKEAGCTDPILLTVACMYICDRESIDRLAARLKWSTDEIEVARKIAEYKDVPAPIAEARHQLIHNRHPHAEEGLKHVLSKVVEFYTVGGAMYVNYFKNFVKPQFPVTGDDMVSLGIKPGAAIGAELKRLKTEWMNGGYTATREELLAMVKLP